MTPPVPKYCDPNAYQWFRSALGELHTTRGLVRAAVAIARHRLQDASFSRVDEQLDSYAQSVSRRIKHRSSPAVLAHLHAVLFEEAGFRGNAADYYHPRNSYLPAVLQSRQGIPITLVLVYKAVGERLGLTVQGLNCPGHFLAEVVDPQEPMIVDPFAGGSILTRAEARERIEQLTGQELVGSDRQLFRVCSHSAWIARMLRNLQHIYSMNEHFQDLQALGELQRALEEHEAAS